MNLQWCSHSIVGPGKDNQDSVLDPVKADSGWWCAIADGVGGSSDGGLASRLCVEGLRTHAETSTEMPSVFSRIQEYLSTNSSESANGKISSTLSVIRIAGSSAFVGHVGDTRIFHLRGKGVIARTRDQTEVQKLLDQGALTKHQAKRYPRRNILLSALSPHGSYELFTSEFDVMPSDRIVLTSDGFHEQINRQEIAAISLANPRFDHFCRALEHTIQSREIKDDATFLALELMASAGS